MHKFLTHIIFLLSLLLFYSCKENDSGNDGAGQISSFSFLESQWSVEGVYLTSDGSKLSITASADFEKDFSETGIQGIVSGTVAGDELEIFFLQNSGTIGEQLIFIDNIRSTLGVFTGDFSNSEFTGNDSDSNSRLTLQNITSEEFGLILENTLSGQVIFDLNFKSQVVPELQFSPTGSTLCSDQRSDEHDFALGSWDVIDTEILQNGNIKRPGTLTAVKILTGCGLLFNRVMASVVEGEDDIKITSLRMFDYQRDLWAIATLTESNTRTSDFAFYMGAFVENETSVTFDGVDRTTNSRFVYNFNDPDKFRESHQVFISSAQQYRNFFISDFTLKD
ncbi:MAG: hypothetical protein ROO71_01740 [Balneola sp.]